MRKSVALILLLLAACSEPPPVPPPDLIPRDRFVQVMADVQVIEARINHEMVVDQRTDGPAQRYYDDLYAEHGISKEQYARTYQWYTEHPLQMKALYEDVLTELGKRKEKGE
jgi:hypothetical protein